MNCVGGIAKYKRIKFYDRQWFAEAVKVFTAMIASAAAVRAFWIDPTSWTTFVASASALGLLAFAFVSIRAGLRRDSKDDDSNHSLQSHINLVFGSVATRAGLTLCSENSAHLRAVAHRFDQQKDEYEQVTEYAGFEGGEPGRSWGITRGVVGKCISSKGTTHFSWNGTDPKELSAALLAWGYSKKEADSMVKIQRSWLASPILSVDGRSVIGAVYLDSSDPEFFNNDIKQLIVDATAGVRFALHSLQGW